MYSPLLLSRKAEKLRSETGDDRYWAPLDKKSTGLKAAVQNVIGTPFTLMATEPMLISLTIYMSVRTLAHILV